MRHDRDDDWSVDVRKAFDEHHALLFRFAYRLTGSRSDAEDIVQACFLELLRPDCSYDPSRATLLAWLFGGVRNQSLKRLRHKASQNMPELRHTVSPEQEVLHSEMEEIVQRAIQMLPEMQREVLILSHYELMPLAEIANVLDIELGAVKSRLQRARGNLRETLIGYAPTERKR